MNCSECRDDFAAYEEGLLEPEAQSRIKSHLAECPACRAEFDQMQNLVVRLTRAGPGASGISLETRVMDRIIHQQAQIIRRLQMRRRKKILGVSGVLTVAVVLLIIAGIFQSPRPENRALAAEVLAQGAEAVLEISSVHIKGRMRTAPHDNFSHVNPERDFVPIELWKQFGRNWKWRVEKPGRVVVMDGTSTIMLIKPDSANKIPHFTNDAFNTGWLLSMTNVKDLTREELQSALAQGWDMQLARKQVEGSEKLIVTVEAKSGLSDYNYIKNKFINSSDTRRIYSFDAKTKQLEAIRIYLHKNNEEVLIFEADQIEYDQPIDPATFSLDLPKNVSWYQEPQKLPDNEKYEKMTPKEAAAAFFEACGKEDWVEAEKFWTGSINKSFKDYLGGLQLISIGEPFRALPYPGWYVPYEIKFKNGKVKKFNLAVRNDNPGKRYVVDGGI